MTLWTVACQAPLSMGFSRQKYWSGLSCPPPGIFPTHGLNPHSYVSRIGRWVLYHHLTSPIRYYYCHPLEKAMATHSSTLAGKIPWAEEPGRLQSMASGRAGHDWVTSLSLFTFALEKEMATHSSVLAWRIPGIAEPGGLPFMGSHRVGHDWSDLAAAAAVSSMFHR